MAELQPEPMSRVALLAILDDIRQHVASGDSLEGHFTWGMPDFNDPDWRDSDGYAQFHVKAVYRIGNLQGQGSIRMIGRR